MGYASVVLDDSEITFLREEGIQLVVHFSIVFCL